MNNNQHDINPRRQKQWQSMTLAQYVERRNGAPLGDSSSLRNTMQRSFGASSFAQFWQYWNPIWGYGLGKYIYSPLQRVLPVMIALIITFVVSGVIHDLVTMALRQSVTFLFTPWFFVLGVGVVIGRAVGMDLSNRSWGFRAGINLTYLVTSLAITLIAKRLLAIP